MFILSSEYEFYLDNWNMYFGYFKENGGWEYKEFLVIELRIYKCFYL